MSLDAGTLVKLAAGLWVAAVVCLGTEKDPAAWKAVRDAVAGLLGYFGLVCAGAAMLLWLVPWWSAGPLGDLTLQQLRTRQETLTRWVEAAWWGPMAAAVLAFSASVLGWGTVRDHQARWLGGALVWTLRMKTLAGLAALFSLAAVGLQHRATDSAAAVAAQIKDLAQLRLSLAEDAARAALLALAGPMAASVDASAQLPRFAQAYWTAEPHLVVPEWHPRGESWRPGLGQEVQRRMDDRSAATMEQAMRDLRHSWPHDTSAEQRLMATVLEAGFDQAAAPLIERFATLGHPLIDEVLKAIADPVFARPLREALVATAGAVLRSGDVRSAMQAQARAAWLQMPSAARQRLGLAVARAAKALPGRTGQPKPPLGEPRWQPARDILQREFQQQSATNLERSLVRAAWSETQPVWDALDIVLVSPGARRADAEQAFGHMLLYGHRHFRGNGRPRLLAAWGKALAQQLQLTTVTGEPNAYEGLMRWYATQPKDFLDDARRRLDSRAATENALARHEAVRVRDAHSPPKTPAHSVRTIPARRGR